MKLSLLRSPTCALAGGPASSLSPPAFLTRKAQLDKRCTVDGIRVWKPVGEQAKAIKRRFGIPDPQEIKAEVDKIVDEKLGGDECEYHFPAIGVDDRTQ